MESAIARAIDECITEGILADILIEQKAEVLELVLTTFNRELYEQGLREDAAREAAEEATKKANEKSNEKIASLEAQAQQLGAENEVLQNQLQKSNAKLTEQEQELAKERQRIAELEAKLAQLENI